ncbi:hypothetical protein [Gordonia terrae]|uniref:Oxidoreductase n=1 Tax=Gordonia terrae NBRC 100016 TaxID=1089454 RepID=A0ABQ0HCE9_9ACTN|nr:hypothetical protein [Gordonia terrae]ANY25411.1 hypothetical protein BCM27_23695 [Gordonia terrae]GAB43549.1 hypothetical protein GOTRE_044_00520 [Gordonia terrae NBRC 100016]VTR08328.1 short chain dehydrogenase [Clostridioides difficile]VTS63173.1 short chain dehydrogenase [Gordonia terrae]
MVVTGAGAGMGRALARRLARAGVELYLVDVDVPAALAGHDRIPVGFDARAIDLGVRLLAGAVQRPVATLTRPVFRRILGDAALRETRPGAVDGASRSR